MAKLQFPIYLDYAATTPVDPKVQSKMNEFLSKDGIFGNPASSHIYGKAALKALEEAQAALANGINASPEAIIWTSGATEANNLAIKGVAQFHQNKGKHIVTSQIEHRSVLETCQALAQQGFEITYLKPDSAGFISLDSLENALRPDTVLVSLMHVNNETGCVQNIEGFGKLLRSRGIFFHVDAAQSLGKLPIDVKALEIDLLSGSAHKFYGPKGIGILFVNDKPKLRLMPQLHGTGQQGGLRSGTLPTHQCVAMAEAFKLCEAEMATENARIQKLRAFFWDGIKDLPGVSLNGNDLSKIPHILNVCFADLDKTSFLDAIQTLAVSGASACTASNTHHTSHVLRAMGLRNELAERSLRFSFGRYTTQTEVEYAVTLICEYFEKSSLNSKETV